MHLISKGVFMDDEIWKPVPSMKGVMVSSFGRILFPSNSASMPHGGKRKYITEPRLGCITKASKKARHTYYAVYHRKFGNVKVHRAVCEAFHGPPPLGKNIVIHIDENALNNRPENLKWGTQKENLNSSKFIEYCKSRIGEKSPHYIHRMKKLNKL